MIYQELPNKKSFDDLHKYARILDCMGANNRHHIFLSEKEFTDNFQFINPFSSYMIPFSKAEESLPIICKILVDGYEFIFINTEKL